MFYYFSLRLSCHGNLLVTSFALLTREISWSTLEINFIFLHIIIQLTIHNNHIEKAWFFSVRVGVQLNTIQSLSN